MSGFQTAVAVVAGLSVLTAAALLPIRWMAHGYPTAKETLVAVRSALKSDVSLMFLETAPLEQQLTDLELELRDHTLRNLFAVVLGALQGSTETSPGPFMFTTGPETPAEREEHARRRLHQAQKDEAIVAVEAALARIRRVERFLILHPAR